jgi:hypothetical protein
MNDNVEDKEAQIAAAAEGVTKAEATVATAQEAADTAKTALTTANASLKEAKGNAKQAAAYMKSIGELTDENAADHKAGQESLDGWNAEVARLEAEAGTTKESKVTTAEALKEAKKALTVAKKALTAAKKEPKAAKPKVVRETANGILRPMEGSKSAIAWGLIETAKEAANGTPTSAQVKEQVDAYNANLVEGQEALKASRVQSAFRKWRKFHGIAVGAPVAAPAAAPA